MNLYAYFLRGFFIACFSGDEARLPDMAALETGGIGDPHHEADQCMAEQRPAMLRRRYAVDRV
jgi:hypothetical protein